MEIRVIENLSDEERRRIFGWGEDIFGAQALDISWRPKDWHIIVDDDGQAMSHVGLLQHTVFVDEQPVKVGGVGGVATALDAQRKGYARHALRYAEDFMCNEWGVDFGFLFCFERLRPFYESLGWSAIKHPIEIDQPSGKIIMSPMMAMSLPCREKTWPAGVVNLDSMPW